MDNKSKKIGLIGLGVMGKPMAKNILKNGFSLTVFDIKPEPVLELVALGAKAAETPAALAASCDIIITMLPNSPIWFRKSDVFSLYSGVRISEAEYCHSSFQVRTQDDFNSFV